MQALSLRAYACLAPQDVTIVVDYLGVLQERNVPFLVSSDNLIRACKGREENDSKIKDFFP